MRKWCYSILTVEQCYAKFKLVYVVHCLHLEDLVWQRKNVAIFVLSRNGTRNWPGGVFERMVKSTKRAYASHLSHDELLTAVSIYHNYCDSTDNSRNASTVHWITFGERGSHSAKKVGAATCRLDNEPVDSVGPMKGRDGRHETALQRAVWECVLEIMCWKFLCHQLLCIVIRHMLWKAVTVRELWPGEATRHCVTEGERDTVDQGSCNLRTGTRLGHQLLLNQLICSHAHSFHALV